MLDDLRHQKVCLKKQKKKNRKREGVRLTHQPQDHMIHVFKEDLTRTRTQGGRDVMSISPHFFLARVDPHVKVQRHFSTETWFIGDGGDRHTSSFSSCLETSLRVVLCRTRECEGRLPTMCLTAFYWDPSHPAYRLVVLCNHDERCALVMYFMHIFCVYV